MALILVNDTTSYLTRPEEFEQVGLLELHCCDGTVMLNVMIHLSKRIGGHLVARIGINNATQPMYNTYKLIDKQAHQAYNLAIALMACDRSDDELIKWGNALIDLAEGHSEFDRNPDTMLYSR